MITHLIPVTDFILLVHSKVTRIDDDGNFINPLGFVFSYADAFPIVVKYAEFMKNKPKFTDFIGDNVLFKNFSVYAETNNKIYIQDNNSTYINYDKSNNSFCKQNVKKLFLENYEMLFSEITELELSDYALELLNLKNINQNGL